MDRAYVRKTSEYSYSDLKASLMYSFLYYGDSEALQILLNLYNIDERIENIFPSYVSLKSLRKDIEGFLYYKEGRDLIAANLSELIHDDINRFELVTYIEGYRRGLASYKEVNQLEVLALDHFSLADLYKKTSLFHYETDLEDVLALKQRAIRRIHEDSAFTKVHLERLNWYNRRVLRKKTKRLNTHLDRQIMINYSPGEGRYRESNNHLSKKELYGLSKKLNRFLHRDALKIYHKAFWNGLNDQVLKRYT